MTSLDDLYDLVTDSNDDNRFLQMLRDKAGGWDAVISTSSVGDVGKFYEYQNATPAVRRLIRKEARKEQTKKNTVCFFATKNNISFWFESDEKNKISFSGNRFKYILRVIENSNNNKNTSINELIIAGTSKERSNISTSIADINKQFKKISSTEKLIGNEKKGYFLNEGFHFTHVK